MARHHQFETRNRAMRTLAGVFLLVGVISVPGAVGLERFEDLGPEALAAQWLFGKTGEGAEKWALTTDFTAPSGSMVLKQAGRADYALALRREPEIKNGSVQVKFKALSGEKDQAGGIIWRARDLQNYYICRANALENNVVLYSVEKGKRKPLDIVGRSGGYGVEIPVPSREWHTLRIEFRGDLFAVYFNGRHLFDVRDSLFRGSGKVGLWTKADSEAVFDDFVFTAED